MTKAWGPFFTVLILSLCTGVNANSLSTAKTSITFDQNLFDQWLSSAQFKAEQGDAVYQNELGIVYLRGEGVEQDYTQAQEWFKKACDSGNQNGCKNYRNLHEHRE